MNTVIQSYAKAKKTNKEEDVMGVIRTLFPDITVEMFLANKTKKKKH